MFSSIFWRRTISRARKAMEKSEWEKAKGILVPLTRHPNGSCRGEAFKLLGTVFFRLKEYPSALSHYEKKLNSLPTTGDYFNAFAAAREVGDPEKVRHYYQQALSHSSREIDAGATPQVTPVNLMFFYLEWLSKNPFPEEMDALAKEITDIYKTLAITDDHFLYVRGLPFFGSLVKLFEKIYAESPEKLKNWATDLSAHIDEDGKKYLVERGLADTME